MMDSFADQAIRILRDNDAGSFIKPSSTQYPHLWNWDSALIALGLSRFDMARAWVEVDTLLGAQWRDGMVPHIVYPAGASDYFPTPEFWQTAGLAHGGNVASSGFTQPPVLASVVRELASRDPDGLARARTAFPRLLAWHRWLHTARDADGTGLPCLIHPWESGTDNSPRWASPLDRVTPRDLPAFKRRDMVHVAADERPLATDYERFIHLIDLDRRAGWAAPRLMAESPFLVQDVMFCAILQRADEDLRALAVQLGEPTAELDAWLQRTRAVFDGRFWNEPRGLYFDWDVRAGQPIAVATIALFFPLYAGLASVQQARRLIEEHYRNPREFGPSDAEPASRLRVPSTSKAEPGYAPKRYWCGPVWVHCNWFIWKGLQRYGFMDEADALAAQTLAFVRAGGFREYYDPRDGAGLGATGFSWTAALALEMGGWQPANTGGTTTD